MASLSERDAWNLWAGVVRRGQASPFDPSSYAVAPAPAAVEARILDQARRQGLAIGRGATVVVDGHRFKITGPGVPAGPETHRGGGLQIR